MEHQSWKEAGHGLHIPLYVQKQVQRVRAMGAHRSNCIYSHTVTTLGRYYTKEKDSTFHLWHNTAISIKEVCPKCRGNRRKGAKVCLGCRGKASKRLRPAGQVSGAWGGTWPRLQRRARAKAHRGALQGLREDEHCGGPAPREE